MVGKMPAFQFYPSDWRNDPNLQMCDLQARGLWIELMGLMHESERYGYLIINKKVPSTDEVARLIRGDKTEVENGWEQLKSNGVLRFTKGGIPYSNRMVKDAKIREVRRKCGKLGGNPNLVKQEVNQEDNHTSNQKPTPPSSSSSSLSSPYKTSLEKLRKDFPIYKKTTDEYLAEMVSEFPGIDHSKVLGKLHAFESDGGNTKNPTLRIRNWFENETKYQSNGKQVNSDGKNYVPAGFPINKP